MCFHGSYILMSGEKFLVSHDNDRLQTEDVFCRVLSHTVCWILINLYDNLESGYITIS